MDKDNLVVDVGLAINDNSSLTIGKSGSVTVNGYLDVKGANSRIIIEPVTGSTDPGVFALTVTGSVTGTLGADVYDTDGSTILKTGNRIEVKADGITDNMAYSIINGANLNPAWLNITLGGAEQAIAYNESGALSLVQVGNKVYLTKAQISSGDMILNTGYSDNTAPLYDNAANPTKAYFNGVNAHNSIQGAIDRIKMTAYTAKNTSEYEQALAFNSTYFAGVNTLTVQTKPDETQTFTGNTDLGALADLTITTDDANRIFRIDGSMTNVGTAATGDIRFTLENAAFINGNKFIGAGAEINGAYTLNFNNTTVGELLIANADIAGATVITLGNNSVIGKLYSNAALANGMTLNLNSGATVGTVDFSNVADAVVTIDGCGITSELTGDGATVVDVKKGFAYGKIVNVKSVTVGSAAGRGEIGSVIGAESVTVVNGLITGSLINVGTVTVNGQENFAGFSATVSNVENLVFSDTAKAYAVGQYTIAKGSTVYGTDARYTNVTISAIASGAMEYNRQYEFGTGKSAFLFNNGSEITLSVVNTDDLLKLGNITVVQDSNGYNFTIKAPVASAFDGNQYSFAFNANGSDVSNKFVLIGRNGDEFTFQLVDNTLQSFSTVVTVTNGSLKDSAGNALSISGSPAADPTAVSDYTAPVIDNVTLERNAYSWTLGYTAADNFGTPDTVVKTYVDGIDTAIPAVSGVYDLSGFVGRRVTFEIVSKDAAGNSTTVRKDVYVSNLSAPQFSEVAMTRQELNGDTYTLTFEAVITDDVAVVGDPALKVWIDGTAYNAAVSKAGDKYTFTVENVPSGFAGDVKFEISAKDATDTSSFFGSATVRDLLKPTDVTVSGEQNDKSYLVSFAAAAKDNVGIASLILTVKNADGKTVYTETKFMNGKDVSADFVFDAAEFVGQTLNYTVTATDVNGFTEVGTGTLAPIKDVTAPFEVVISSIVQNADYSFTLEVMGKDNVGIADFTVWYSFDGGAWTEFTPAETADRNKATITFDALNDPSNTGKQVKFYVVANDGTNISESAVSTVAIKDMNAPEIANINAVQTRAGDDTYTLTVTATITDAEAALKGARMDVLVNGQTYTAVGTNAGDVYTFVVNGISSAVTGGVEFKISAQDGTFTTVETGKIDFTDLIEPAVKIASVAQLGNSYTFEVQVTGSDNVGIVKYDLTVTDTNGNPINATLEPVAGNSGKFLVTVDSEATTLGDLTFDLNATDKAGNTVSDSFTKDDIRDITAPVPVTEFTVTHNEALNSGKYTLKATAGTYTDNSGAAITPSYEIYNGSTLIGTDLSADFAAYAGKELTVVEIAKDAAGNTTTQSRTVKINDVTSPVAPAVEIVKQSEDGYKFYVSVGSIDNLAVAAYELTVTDKDGNVLRSMTAQPAAGDRALFEVDALPDQALQDITFTVVAKDAAGNSSTASRTLNVADVTAPEITATSIVQKKADRELGESGYGFNVAVSATDNVTAIEAMTFTVKVYANVGANDAAMYTYEDLAYNTAIGGVAIELPKVTYDTNYWYTVTADDRNGNSTTTDFVAFTAAGEMGDVNNPEKKIVADNFEQVTTSLKGDLTEYKAANYYKLSMEIASINNLTISGVGPGEKARITVINANGKKKKYIATEKKNTFTGLLLDAGTTTVIVESTAKKMNVADYKLDVDTTFFAKSNYNSADSAFQLISTEKRDATQTRSNSDWVGYGDAKDYYKLTSECAGSYNVTLQTTSGKVKVSFLNEAGKKVKSMTVSANSAKSISNLLFYSKSKINGQNVAYIAVESASKGKNAKHNTDYSLTVTESVFNKGDNGTVVQLGSVGKNEVSATDWLGYGDSQDVFRFTADATGILTLDLEKLTGSSEYDLNRIKVKVLDANGKSVSMSKVAGSSIETGFSYNSKKALSAGSDYTVQLTLGNEKKYKADYNIGLAIV